MERTLSKQAVKKIGEKIMLKGWLHSLRLLGSVNFLILRDRDGLIQVVIQDKNELKKVKDLQPGSILTIEGEVQKAEKAELGVEIVNPQIKVEVEIKEPLPLDISKPELNAHIDTILDYRSLALRNEKIRAIFKLQAGILEAFTDSMRSQGFTQFVSPVLMGSPSESGADVFEVKYFENKAYLAQSPQVYKQIMVGAFERVFTIAKVFRAEKHNTSRHLMEITQLDGEMGFIESYDEVLDVVERFARDVMAHLEKNYATEIEILGAQLPKLPEGKFPRVRVREALRIIEERTGKSAAREELDVEPDDEREIAKWALEEHGSDFVWLLNFKANKNFYTWDNPEAKDESLSYDLLLRGLECLSGTHRIHIYELLLERLLKQGLNPEHYDHYLQAFKYGMPSEAGFSFGLERMTQQIIGAANVREATLFPSDLKRIASAKIKQQVVKGGEETVAKIKEILENRGVKYEFFEHEATVTSDDAARIRGTKPEEGVKALIIKGKKSGKNYMFCGPGNEKTDFKKVSRIIGEKVEFEKPEVIKEKFGLEIGGVPPFGNLFGLEVYFDEKIKEEEYSSFNCGSKFKSIRMKSADLIDVVNPTVVDLSA